MKTILVAAALFAVTLGQAEASRCSFPIKAYGSVLLGELFPTLGDMIRNTNGRYVNSNGSNRYSSNGHVRPITILAVKTPEQMKRLYPGLAGYYAEVELRLQGDRRTYWTPAADQFLLRNQSQLFRYGGLLPCDP